MTTAGQPAARESGRGRLFGNFLWNLSAGGWGILLALVSTPLVVHQLGAAQYGIYALLGVLLSYLAFADLGLSKAVERHAAAALGAGEPERVRGYFGTAFWLQLGIASSVGLLVALAGPPLLSLFEIPADHAAEARTAIRWISLNVTVNFIAGAPQALLQAYQRFATLNRISIFSQTLLTLMTVGAALRWGTLGSVVVALVLGSSVRGALLLVFALRLITPRRPAFDRGAVRELLGFGGSLTAANVLAPVLVHAEKLMLGALVSATSLTFYMVPYRFLSRLSLVSASLRRALFPLLSEHEGRGDLVAMHRSNRRATELLAWLLLPGFAVLWIAGQSLLGLWMGNDFAGQAAGVLPFLVTGTFVNLLAVNAVALIQARGRPGLVAWLYAVELVLYLPAAYWLMNRYGLPGAAASWFVRVALDYVLLWQTASYLFRGQATRSFWIWKPFLAAATLFGLGQALQRTTSDPRLLLAAGLAAAVAATVAGWFAGFSAGERRDLRRQLSGALRGLARGILVRLYVRRLRRATKRSRGPRQWHDVARNLTLGPLSIRPMQVREEIVELLVELERRRPRRVLEIGTARGGTLYLFSRAASDDALLVSVDLPAGPFGGGYPAWKESIYRSFAAPGQRIELLRNDSRDPAVVARVRELAADGLDFLYIDGDHRYEGVRADFETYLPLVAPGGLVALHDIRPNDPESGGEVPRFWNEIKTGFRHREIVAADGKGFGIGLLWK